MAVLAVHIWFFILVPLFPRLRNFQGTEEKGYFSLDGRYVVGGLIAVFADGFLDC